MQNPFHTMAFLLGHRPVIPLEGNQTQQNATSNPGDDHHQHPMAHDRVVLKVGERRFETFRATLTSESTYFAARLSGHWTDTDAVDGSYFIDTDPDVFQHVLGYLRNGIPPLFYNAAANAFDYERYVALLGQARYFGIARLEDWIEKQRYLSAVKTKYTPILVSGENVLQEISDRFEAVQGNAKLEFYPVWDTKKIYLCPRRVPVHRGQPESCGKQCNKSGTGDYEEEKVLKVLVTRNEVIFDPTVCVDGVGED